MKVIVSYIILSYCVDVMCFCRSICRIFFPSSCVYMLWYLCSNGREREEKKFVTDAAEEAFFSPSLSLPSLKTSMFKASFAGVGVVVSSFEWSILVVSLYHFGGWNYLFHKWYSVSVRLKYCTCAIKSSDLVN